MILRGIVKEEEMERIKEALSYHGLVNGRPGDFRAWKSAEEDVAAQWVEVDVHQSLFEYLTQSGFFDDRSDDVHSLDLHLSNSKPKR